MTIKAVSSMGNRTISKSRILTCPIRGDLNTAEIAKDGLTISEEARRIECIDFLLIKGYPKSNFAVETKVIQFLGESGRNSLRVDLIIYDRPIDQIISISYPDILQYAIIVAEIKRDSKKEQRAIIYQLEPAMRQLPNLNVIGIYWDDITRKLLIKKIVRKNNQDFMEVNVDDVIQNLPKFGRAYKTKAIIYDDLIPPDNLVPILLSLTNIMRSHHVNDEHLRYKETIKLILARYCDERQAASSPGRELALQLLPGGDPGFKDRIIYYYRMAAQRYNKAKTLFHPIKESELEERTLREFVRQIQGIRLTAATNEAMQQVFLSFVPGLLQRDLGQYFTPLSLIRAMVEMVNIGPNDNVVDPAMGTGDFLTAAMEFRVNQGDEDIIQRIHGVDSDQKAYDLAIINMILHRDGQGNLCREDSIANYEKWNGKMAIALCNPPFGEKSVEKRQEVLRAYELGHIWEYDETIRKWQITERVRGKQQLGILFMERCYKMLFEGSRLAIIWPEGYLCVETYGYIRQWILDRMRILSLVELPRRIFTRSNADLRSNIIVCQKLSQSDLTSVIIRNYPIQAGVVRKIGYKLGKGGGIITKKDPETGIALRDSNNQVIMDTDFSTITSRFNIFTELSRWNQPISQQPRSLIDSWGGATIEDISLHPMLDMKPRRLTEAALQNKRNLLSLPHIQLGEIADVVEDKEDLIKGAVVSMLLRFVEGSDIRAIEGTVVPKYPCRAWEIAGDKSSSVYRLIYGDIIVGLVRPERRNIGMLLDKGNDLVGIPDGIAVVRVKKEFLKKYSQEWLFAEMRSEKSRLQLWTESGGTSYGKLTHNHILDLVLVKPDSSVMMETTKKIKRWAKSNALSAGTWQEVGSEQDRVPIINSPITGLEEEDYE